MPLSLANCDECPLGELHRRNDDFAPVMAESHAGDRIVILGEAPGGHEVIEGRPFVGPSGGELQSALEAKAEGGETQAYSSHLLRSPNVGGDFFLRQVHLPRGYRSGFSSWRQS